MVHFIGTFVISSGHGSVGILQLLSKKTLFQVQGARPTTYDLIRKALEHSNRSEQPVNAEIIATSVSN